MEYCTVYRGALAQITEKKSRFIAQVFPVKTEQQAVETIESVRKEYWDAKHNCYAYILGKKEKKERFSDDKEPAGTAGKPILEVLCGCQVTDALIVVTRYFGGTLLGTGGLIRTYSLAAKEALNQSVLVTASSGFLVTLTTDYANIGNVTHCLSRFDISGFDVTYTDKVKFCFAVKEEDFTDLQAAMDEITGRKAVFDGEKKPIFFAFADDKLVILD